MSVKAFPGTGRAVRLLVMNQYYSPDVASTGQLAAELCAHLAQAGFEVHVVTGQPSYTATSPEAPPYEVLDGVHVHRVSLGGCRGRERMTTRVSGYIRFLWGAWWQARALLKDGQFDTLITFHNPPVIGILGALLARRFRLRYVYIPYDLHPDVLVATGWPLPRPVVWAWERINRWIYAHAHAVIVLSQGMKQTLLRKGVPGTKVHVIPPWARPELRPIPKPPEVRKALGIGEKDLLLLYAGNMGIMHPLDPILDAARMLREAPVHFLFVGDGARRPRLVARAREERLARVHFLPFQPLDRFCQLVAAADACLVVLQPGLERLALPSRAFTFLSAGRPLITLMSPEAELVDLVTRAQCGWNVTSGEALSALIRTLLAHPEELARRGANGRTLYESRFRRAHIMEAYTAVIGGMVP